MNKLKVLLLLSLCLWLSSPVHSKDLISVGYTNLLATSASLNEYFKQQLQLALDKTEKLYGKTQLVQAKTPMYQSAALVALRKRNQVDVVWTSYSSDRASHAKAIRLDLLKGLNDYRIPVVSTKADAALQGADSLKSLSRFVGLQGHDWIDTSFLRQHGLNLKSDFQFESIVEKVASSNRHYYLSSIVAGIQKEISKHHQLVTNTNLLIKYDSPVYYFVNKSNASLAKRIEKGLQLSVEDGSFDQLLISFLKQNSSINQLNLKRRKLVSLSIPHDKVHGTPISGVKLSIDDVTELLVQ